MKRRDFLSCSVGIVGLGLPALSRAESKPCPPGSIAVSGGTTSGAICDSLATGRPTWLNGRAVNEWFEIPGTVLADADPATIPPKVRGLNGPQSKITAWCGAALRRSGSVYLIGANGGHGDYAGNEVQALTLGVDSPSWRTLRSFSAEDVLVNAAPIYKDFRRSATHTYYSLQFVNQDDRLVVCPSPGMGTGQLPDDPDFSAKYPQSLFTSFSLTTNDWDADTIKQTGAGFYASHPDLKGDFTAALCCANPKTGDIYYSRSGSGGKFWKWSRSTNVWSVLQAPMYHNNYAGSAIDPNRGYMLVVGNFGGDQPPRVYDIQTGGQLKVSFAGLGEGALYFGDAVGGKYPAVAFDEANDRFLVFRNANPIVTYSVDPKSWVVTELAVSGSVPGQRDQGLHNAVQYVPELSGVVVVTRYGGNAHFMRVA